ncbi:MAG: DUF1559 domain-containing protein [Planctomycetaceae bacterium]|nr:DUF1559 domain-containing protein [Planctomycetaceae bacterium]
MTRSPVAMSRGNRAGFTIIELLVVIGILLLLGALFMPATRRAREPARRAACKSNLKQIAVALHNYHEQYGCFPPAYTMGPDCKPLHSWRTLLLPYMDHKDLYEKIDLSKPWDDPVNAKVFQSEENRVWVYQCPSLSTPATHTTYLGMVGDEYAFHPQRGRALRELKDGASNTLMVIEVAPENAVPWMAPVDSDGREFVDFTEDSSTTHHGGGHGLFADGSVWFFGAHDSVARRRGLLTIAGDDHVEE